MSIYNWSLKIIRLPLPGCVSPHCFGGAGRSLSQGLMGTGEIQMRGLIKRRGRIRKAARDEWVLFPRPPRWLRSIVQPLGVRDKIPEDWCFGVLGFFCFLVFFLSDGHKFPLAAWMGWVGEFMAGPHWQQTSYSSFCWLKIKKQKFLL